jgi:hypothetical protein
VRWPEIALRLILIASLFAAIFSGVTVWLMAPLGLIAIAATTELAVRPYSANSVDRLLLGCGAVVTAFIVIGLALNLTPWGLTKTTWNAAFLVVSIGVLIWRREIRTNFGWPAAEMRSLGGWMVAASLMLVAAGIVTLAGVQRSDQQPVLAFSVVSESTNAVVVEMEATSITGSYQITATSKGPKARTYSSALFTVNAGSDGEQIRKRVPISIAGSWTIYLRSADEGKNVRKLEVDPH